MIPVASYIGIPFKAKGRDSTGLDCWGLVRLIYREQLGIDLPSCTESYATVHDGAEIEAAIDGQRRGWREVPLAAARPGDVVLLRIKAHRWHVGLLWQSGWFIHADLHAGVIAERVDAAVWAQRLAGLYRHPQCEGVSA